MPKWDFEFALIEITGNKIIVNSQVNYTDIEKKYKDLIRNLNKENEAILKKIFIKKKIKEETLGYLTKDEIIEFFNRIAAREGTEAKAVKSTTAITPAATVGRAGRAEEPTESKYLVKVVESIDFNSKHNGEIIDSTVSGQIIVQNNGEKDRIWDIDLELSGGESADIREKKIHINDLEPKEQWTKDYKIKIESENKPPVKITEIIDTFPESKEGSNIFILNKESKGQLTQFKINIENTSDKKVSNILLTKTITEDFKDLKIKKEGQGSAKKEDGTIAWKIDEVNPKESIDLEFEAKVYPTEIKSISSGEIKIKYLLEAGTFSGLKPTFVDGLSEEIYFVDRNEREEEPDKWDCKLNFKNRSEFPMELQKFTLISGDENTEYATESQEPKVIINPGVEWDSEPWILESEDEPTFSEYVLYSVHPKIEERLSMSSTIQALEAGLQVLAVEGTKDFSKHVLKSYRAETLDATIFATIKGTAPIDIIRFEDTIPKDFKRPERESMEILLEVADKKKPLKIENFSVSYEPARETDDFSLESKMKIEIKDVLSTVGALADGTGIKVTYPLNAIKPTRDAKYDAPVLFQAYTRPAGAPLEAYFKPEAIIVTHERRRTQIGKSIIPGAEKDDYRILLIYKNNGDGLKTKIKISDFIPAAYKILESDKEYEEKSKDGGKLLTWTIDEIPPGKEIEINYSIHGIEEEYTLKNIEVRAYK